MYKKSITTFEIRDFKNQRY